MYIEISELFQNHTTVIEKNYIAIHIDIELLSSPTKGLILNNVSEAISLQH